MTEREAGMKWADRICIVVGLVAASVGVGVGWCGTVADGCVRELAEEAVAGACLETST